MSLTNTVPVLVPSLFPQLVARAPIRGAEIQCPVHVRQLTGTGTARTRVDVLDQRRTRAGAVALPQFVAIGSVVGAEIQRPVHVRQLTGASAASSRAMSLTNTVPALVPSLFHSS